jgi:hypothetical protein
VHNLAEFCTSQLINFVPSPGTVASDSVYGMHADQQAPLSDQEIAGIVLAVQSTFTKLRNLYQQVQPVFASFGFAAPAPGSIAHDLSDRIEAAITRHCASFERGDAGGGLRRNNAAWHVKVSRDTALTVGHGHIAQGDSYIVVNYKPTGQVTRVWVLWNTRDHFFTSRRANSSARALVRSLAAPHVQLLHVPDTTSASRIATKGRPAKAQIARLRRPHAHAV